MVPASGEVIFSVTAMSLASIVDSLKACSAESKVPDPVRLRSVLIEAGAGAIHAHNTSFDLLGENAFKDYMRTWETVLDKHPDITWYPTTCNNLRLIGDEHGLEHVALLNEHAHAEIACVDTGLTLFATHTDDEGYLVGPEFGFNYARVGRQWRMLRERGVPMVYGVYEPGHLRHAMYYVNQGMSTPGSMWDFYLIGDYGLTATEPIGTNGMKPSLESLYYYLHMIEELARHCGQADILREQVLAADAGR